MRVPSTYSNSDQICHHEASCLKGRRIPLYIVKELDCLEGHAVPDHNDLNHTSPIFRYAAVDDQKKVLLVKKGADGVLYTTGP